MVDLAYPANASDVTSEVGKIISAKPDVVMHAAYITDAILFTKTFKEMNLVPQGFLTMAGYVESDYLPTVKADGNYFLVRSTFALDLAKKKPMVGQVADLYQQKYNIPMGENTARSFSAPFVLADAFNRAKSTEPEAVVKALLETNIPGRPDHQSMEGHPVRSQIPPEHSRFSDAGADPGSGLLHGLALRCCQS